MKKLSFCIFLFLSLCNVSFADLENKFLYCDVQKPDPEYLILGCALVDTISNNHFVLKGLN